MGSPQPLLTRKAKAQSLVLAVGADKACSRDRSGTGRLSHSAFLLVPSPTATATPEGSKFPEISHLEWHLPDMHGAQQGSQTQKEGQEQGWIAMEERLGRTRLALRSLGPTSSW